MRIGFGGGGSDPPHCFSEIGGAVINTTVSLYSHATLRIRDDSRIVVSRATSAKHLWPTTSHPPSREAGRFGLVQALLKAISPDFGFELTYIGLPHEVGSLGRPSYRPSVLGCFNQFRRDQWDQNELAELAYQAERPLPGRRRGWQDQYATVFGDSTLEFRMDQNIVHPLRIRPDILLELEEPRALRHGNDPRFRRYPRRPAPADAAR